MIGRIVSERSVQDLTSVCRARAFAGFCRKRTRSPAKCSYGHKYRCALSEDEARWVAIHPTARHE
jgi:hypothetical protein